MRSYELEGAPEPALGWDEYERLILAEWDAVLNGQPSP